jgi:protein TonB
MKTRVTLFAFMPYGAPELIECARPHLARALLLSTLLVSAALLAVLNLAAALGRHVEVAEIAVVEISLRPPPTLEPLAPPEIPIARPTASPRAGIVVPVVEARADPGATLPSQDDLRRVDPGASAEPGDRRPLVVAPPDEPWPTPEQYVHVEELPQVVTRFPPVYPEIAQAAQVEGTVLVQALVGKQGRVLEVRVQRGHSVPLLDDAALDAVRRWVFTPALSDGHPVLVWVRIPVVFRLR